MPFQPTDELTLKLTVAEWNQVIAQLNEGVHKIVAPLIQKISVQAAMHEKASQQVQPGFANGEMQEDGTKPSIPAGTLVRGDLN